MPQGRRKKYADLDQVAPSTTGGKKYADFDQVSPQGTHSPGSHKYSDFDTVSPPQSGLGTAKNLALGAEQTVYGELVPSALSGLEALGSAMTGDFGPAKEIGESALRRVGSILLAGSPVAGIPIPVGPLAANEQAIADVAARQAARREGSPIYGAVEQARQEVEAEAAKDPSLRGRIERGVGRFATAAAPAVITGALTGGSVPAMSAVSAAQTLNAPENIPLAVGLGALPVPAGKLVAPILRRIRGARGGAVGAEDAALPAVSKVSIPEEAAIRAEQGLPQLEADLSIRGSASAASRASGVSMRGPAAESAAFDIGADPTLVTKAERTPIRETLSALYKAGLLGVKTHLRNIGGTGFYQLGEEASRVPAVVADLAVSAVRGRRTITGPSLGSMLRSAREAATKGVDEAKQILRRGITDADIERLGLNQEINTGNRVLDTYVNGTFRVLSAEDRIFKTYAMRRSLEDRARSMALTEIRQGQLTRGDFSKRVSELVEQPPASLTAEAYLDSEIATFNNPNRISEGLRAFRDKQGPNAQLTFDLLFPFTRTPTNVIARMLDYSPVGLAKSGVQVARAITKRSMTDAQQRAFAQTFGRGATGSGLIALGAYLYNQGFATGLYEDEPSKRARDQAAGRIPGAILNPFTNTWHQVAGIAPLGNLIAISASIAREASEERKDYSQLPWKVAGVATQAIGEQPLLIGTKQIAQAITSPGTVPERLGSIAAGAVPTHLSDIGELLDTTQREGKGFLGRIEKRIPGLRQTLPPATDVLGNLIEDRRTQFIDPTRTTTAQQFTNPLYRELVRLDAGVSGMEKKKDETENEYRAKVQDFGDIYSRFGLTLIADPQYGAATDQTRREAFRFLNDRAKTLVDEDHQAWAPGRLNPTALIRSANVAIRKAEIKAKK